MIYKKPINLLGKCTKMANRHSYHMRCTGNQATCQQTLLNVIYILSITRYAVQVNRQKLNMMIDALQRSNEDLNRLLNITEILIQCIRYQLMYIYMHTILAYLRDSHTYIMNPLCGCSYNQYIVTWPEKYPLTHRIWTTLNNAPAISLDDTLHFFYWYLSTHVLIAEGWFLLLIIEPKQNTAQQLQIYQFHIVTTYQPNTKLTTDT